jgi:hypothetical protein
VGDEPIQLDEAAFIEQQVESFAGSELALLVLLGDTVRAAALLGKRLAVAKIVEEFPGVGHGGRR